MTDVFISYAREDRGLAQALAHDLQVRGYRVWWDVELVGSDDFQDVILAALEKAKAVIVIWTKASVKSLFVRDEARYALHHKKFIALKEPDLEVLSIPFGFQSQHTEDLRYRDQIVRAIAKLGVAGSAPAETAHAATAPAESSDSWERVRDTTDVDVLLAWLEDNPTHVNRPQAFQRVRRLVEAGGRTTTVEKSQAISRSSNLSAFLSGLVLRVPAFQFSAQSKWSSIGFSIGLVLFLMVGIVLAFYLAFAIEQRLHGLDTIIAVEGTTAFPLVSIALAILVLFAKSRFSAWAEERNFAAAWILAPVFALLSGVFLVSVVVSLSAIRGKVWQPGEFPGGDAGIFGVVAIGGLLSIIYMIRRIRSVR